MVKRLRKKKKKKYVIYNTTFIVIAIIMSSLFYSLFRVKFCLNLYFKKKRLLKKVILNGNQSKGTI